MIILGINAYHGDSSACVVRDGELVCAIEEERIRRVKHWAGLPTESIKWCLSDAGVGIQDVDHIAISRNPSAHLHKKLLRALTKAPKIGFLANRLQNAFKIKDIKSSLAEVLGISDSDLKSTVHNVEHHRAHLASAFFVSSLDEAACISVDGFGDFLSVMRGMGVGNRIEVHDYVEYPHSLGVFYTAFTQFLGFSKYGDEYKVMGLSAYGEPVHLDKMREIVRLKPDGLFELETIYFLHDKEGVDMVWEDGEPELGQIYSDRLTDLFGEPRDYEDEITAHHKNIAASVQAIYEEAFFHLLNSFYEKNATKSIALAGGCIQNSLANGKIESRTQYDQVFIPPGAADSGTAIGAAFWVWNQVLGQERGFEMDVPYWGPEYGDDEIESVLRDCSESLKLLDETQLLETVVRAVMDGCVVAWFQGRTEWGPRALGNRSIVVDPRRNDMQDILNARIKKREWFRPFAPSILAECVGEWFESISPVPFMEKVYEVKQNKRHLVPAVVHEDGTGRLQTVSEHINQRYYRLIKLFGERTGVPILLNTSFNENEPIVNSPTEALDCFKRTKIDLLVMNNYCVFR